MSNEDKRIYLVRSTNEDNNAFVGVRIKNESIEFHYPESYDISGVEDVSTIKDIKAFRRDMIDILHTISLAKTRSSSMQKTENGISSAKNFTFMSYLWIIRDYISNGIYRNTEKIYRNNAKGKINWKRTLSTQPIISNGNVIYNNLVVEVNNDCDTIITEAHRFCVYDSVRKTGWLFGINEKAFYVPSPTENLLKKYINTIKVELKKTFDDVKKLRLNHMLKVLSGVDDSKNVSEIVYGVDKYHYIYERMVDAIFGNVIDMKEYNPSASWFIMKSPDTYKEKEASHLRPDTIRFEDTPKTCLFDNATKTAYILDAKFYRYGTTCLETDLPETPSIQKQVTYAEHLMKYWKDHKKENVKAVHNAFVLPYNKNNNAFEFNNNLEYIGFSKANWTDNDKNVVHAFLIDTKHLIASWSQGNCKEDIDKLIKDIEEYVEKHDSWQSV